MPNDIRKPTRDRILSRKWESLIKRGLTPPKSSEENRKRAREAHGC